MTDPLAALRKLADEMRYWERTADPTVRAWASTLDSALRLLGEGEVGDVPKVVQTAPKRIWLQVSDDAMDADRLFSERDETTWCQDSVMACEVPYVRADLASPVPAAVEVPEERTDTEAPVHYDGYQAGAWASGWNCCRAEIKRLNPERTNG